MKLRRNSIRPLRLEVASHPDCAGECKRLHGLLEGLPKESFASMLANEPMGKEICGCADVLVRLLGMPNFLLSEYEQDRRQSELGRLFKFASRLHSMVDSVVLFGTMDVCLGAQAILDSCCQPFWNELSRADRGSKPRIYLTEDDCLADNDTIQGLLHLLDTHRPQTTKSESERWGVVAIDPEQSPSEAYVAHGAFLSALRESASFDKTDIHELLFAVAPQFNVSSTHGELWEGSTQLPYRHLLDGCLSVLSAPGLVPAAILGVNVIELLQGAKFMSEHFATANPEDNLVLRWIASRRANAVWTGNLGHEARALGMKVWNRSLAGFARWHHRLTTSRSTWCNFAMESNSTNASVGCSQKSWATTQIIVEGHRFDALRPFSQASDSNLPADPALAASLPDRLSAKIAKSLPIPSAPPIPSAQECPWTSLIVPCADELHMGQLIQMMMLVTIVENVLEKIEVP